MARRYEWGFIGAGNMAEGIVGAMIDRQLCSAEKIILSDPVLDRLRLFSDKYGTAITDSNWELVTDSRRVMLSIKPQSFEEVAANLGDVVEEDHLLVSIMAGVSTGRIAAAFPKIKARVVRVMPNLPIRVGAGIAGIYPGEHATAEDVELVKAVFDAGGSSVVVKEEGQLDAVTGVAGSGPAYFYSFVEAIVAGGVASGLSEADALKLAEHTCLGAAKMMLETGESPAELRRKVTSKGGTTQAALEHMNKLAVGDAIRDAVVAATRRSKELGS